DSKLEYEKVAQYAKIIVDARNSIHFINDFRNNDPDVSFYFKNGSWWYIDPGQGAIEAGDLSTAGLAKIAGDHKVNINIPAPRALSDSIKSALLKYRNLQIVGNPNDAQYALFGTVDNNGILSFGLVRTQLS